MIKGIRFGIVLFMLLMFLAFFACTQPRWKGTIAKEGDVTVIKNPREPLYKIPVVELKEDLSIGGKDAQDDYALGDIRDVVVDDAGVIYVLDSENFHIKVFDPSGKFLRTIGRKGQGPGEFEIPLMMSLVKTRGELAVHQVTRRMSFFKTDGTFLRHHLFKDLWAGRGVCDSTGRIYIMEVRRGDSGSRFVTEKLAEDGTIEATLGDSPASSGDKFNPFRPVGWFMIDGSDNFVYGYPETFEIQFFGASDAKVFKKIVRDYEPVAVTAEERAEQEKSAQGRGIVFDFPKYHPAYRRFFLSDLGHILVATFEKAADGKIIHDIFDPEGRFIGRIPLKRLGVGIFKGKYYAREEDEEGYPILKRYAVAWLVK
ncbi:MAG: 6-bladed beta-propeller [Candidatus Aminicenantes bacterium]|nr:6-bladed beta-propeller [Candidatus Aminicenantes bacterium]